MLSRRLASATVIIAAMIGLIVADYYLGAAKEISRPGLVLTALAIIVAMLSAYELVALFRSKYVNLRTTNHVTVSGIAIAICALPILWKEYPVDCPIGLFGWMMLAMTFAIGITLLLEILSYSKNDDSTGRAAISVLIYVQIILLFGFLIAHRLLYWDNAVGMIALITLISTVKMSDAAAYFFGKTFGRHKLAPALSPGKTIEGLLGSFIGAAIGAAIVTCVVAPFIFKVDLKISWWWLTIYSVAVTVAGVVGDLSESMFKRDAQTKDSSSWLPGLGGVLDITDSLLFAAPVSYFLWLLTK